MSESDIAWGESLKETSGFYADEQGQFNSHIGGVAVLKGVWYCGTFTGNRTDFVTQPGKAIYYTRATNEMVIVSNLLGSKMAIVSPRWAQDNIKAHRYQGLGREGDLVEARSSRQDQLNEAFGNLHTAGEIRNLVEQEALDIILGGVTKMNKTVVMVQFDSNSRQYAYYTDLDLQTGDKVLVHSSMSGHTVATVSNTHPSPSQARLAGKWIIQQVDLDRVKRLQQADDEAKAYRARMRAEYRDKMKRRLASLDEFKVFEILAEHDTSIRDYLLLYKTHLDN